MKATRYKEESVRIELHMSMEEADALAAMLQNGPEDEDDVAKQVRRVIFNTIRNIKT